MPSIIPWLILCFILITTNQYPQTTIIKLIVVLSVLIVVAYYHMSDPYLGFVVLIFVGIFITQTRLSEGLVQRRLTINNDDKSKYLSTASSIYHISPEHPTFDSKNFGAIDFVHVDPIQPEDVSNYLVSPTQSPEKMTETLSHLECLRHFTGSGTLSNYAIIADDKLDTAYINLWRESLDKIADNAPNKWEIIVVGYEYAGQTPLSTKSLYEQLSPDYTIHAYIINKKSASRIIESKIFREKDKNAYNLVDTVSDVRKILFEECNTFVYKYPLFCSSPAVDHIMYDRDSDMFKNVEMVVARYNESLEWLKEYPYNKLPVVVINKGPNDNYYKSPNMVREVKLPNVGKCDHTYIKHIIDNYDQGLKPITMFLTGSTDALAHKRAHSTSIIESLEHDLRTTMVVQNYPDVKKSLFEFTMNSYQSNDARNAGNSKLYPASVRPFGKWFENKFGKDFLIQQVAYYGVFSVSNEDVHNRPKTFYEDLEKELAVAVNPEVGHYVERSWVAIFHPLKKAKFL